LQGQDNAENLGKEEGKLKRTSLFIIRGILEGVNRSVDHKARFLEIATCTPELRNRKKMLAYLKLLVEELGWLERKEQVERTRWNPIKTNYRNRRWTVSWYSLTTSGKKFLELFPSPLVHEVEDEKLPTPEEQARNWKEWQTLNWKAQD